MGDFMKGSWIPKIGALIGLAGTTMVMVEPIWGTVLIGLGAAIGNFASRQNNVTSEQAGAKDPEVVVVVTPPEVVVERPLVSPSKRSHHK